MMNPAWATCKVAPEAKMLEYIHELGVREAVVPPPEEILRPEEEERGSWLVKY